MMWLLQSAAEAGRGTTAAELPCLSQIPHDSLPSLIQLACGPGYKVADGLVTAGNALWIVAYILVVISAARAKTYGVPLLAIVLNFTWELYFAVFQPQSTLALRAVNWAWLALDGIIVYQLMRYGRGSVRPQLQKSFGLWLAALFAAALVGHATFHDWISHIGVFPDSGSAFSGMYLNLIMSVLFVFLALDRPDSRGLSYPAAWAKCIATVMISIGLLMSFSSRAAGRWEFLVRHEGATQSFPMEARGMSSYHPAFIYYMGALIFIFDVIYIVMLERRRQAGSATFSSPAGATARA